MLDTYFIKARIIKLSAQFNQAKMTPKTIAVFKEFGLENESSKNLPPAEKLKIKKGELKEATSFFIGKYLEMRTRIGMEKNFFTKNESLRFYILHILALEESFKTNDVVVMMSFSLERDVTTISREIHLMITETWQFLLSSEKQAFSVIKNENVSTSIYAVSQDGIKRLR